MRRLTLCAGLALMALAGVSASAGAQSSQFGIRGLGLPGRTLSARSFALGGGFGLFDGESALNPAALSLLPVLTASFTGAQNWRTSENPFGEATAKDNRFPQVFVAGPLGPRFSLGVSLGAYTDRSFALASRDTVAPRGEPIAVYDTVVSRGGVSDLRLASSFRVIPGLTVGLGLHAISGSTRLESRLTFSDTSYASSITRSELSFAGAGISAGVHAVFGTKLAIAGMVRTDTKLNLDRDSTRIASTDLPTTVSGGVMLLPTPSVAVMGSATWRSWSVADQDLKAQGGEGAHNTVEVSGGVEITPDPRRPFTRPLRFGVRYAQLPFPVIAGQKAKEIGISLGSGLRFTRGRGGLDLAVERVWRNDGGDFRERALIVTLGVSIRP